MIKERMSSHRSDLALNRNTATGIHFNEPLHSIKNLVITDPSPALLPADLAEYTTLVRYNIERDFMRIGYIYPKGLNNYPFIL